MDIAALNEQGERMVLDHDPVPPYDKVFWIIFIAGLAYLAFIILIAMGESPSAGH